jgi:hypothetical protein
MVQVRLTEITGGTYPISVYISDIYGNNQTLLGTISTGTTVPPIIYYNTVIPSVFQTAPEIMLKLVDANNCEAIKILDCTFGCTFNITIELASCVVNIDIQEANCAVSLDIQDPSCGVSLSITDPSCGFVLA